MVTTNIMMAWYGMGLIPLPAAAVTINTVSFNIQLGREKLFENCNQGLASLEK